MGDLWPCPPSAAPCVGGVWLYWVGSLSSAGGGGLWVLWPLWWLAGPGVGGWLSGWWDGWPYGLTCPWDCQVFGLPVGWGLLPGSVWWGWAVPILPVDTPRYRHIQTCIYIYINTNTHHSCTHANSGTHADANISMMRTTMKPRWRCCWLWLCLISLMLSSLYVINMNCLVLTLCAALPLS